MKRPIAAWKLTLSVFASCGLLACSVEDIVAGRAGGNGAQDAAAPPEDGATAQDAAPEDCRSNADCARNEFCESSSCNGSPGRCRAIPSSCGSEMAEVCGCDGVTYFNDCLRAAAGIPKNLDGQCAFEGRRCGGGEPPCKQGQFCAQLVPFDGPRPCPPNPPGTCWVVPSQCPMPPPVGGRFDACDGAPLSCMDACRAISSGHPHVRSRAMCQRPGP